MRMTTIRDACAGDVPAILELRNHAILHTTANWSVTPESSDDVADWLADRRAAGDAVLVADLGGSVVGDAAYAQWRPRWGYRHTAEDSVYVAEDHHGRGIGRRLLTELIIRARNSGKHVMIADIESSNVASINLHRSLGFVPAGRLPEIGHKFERWLDLSIFTLPLDPAGSS